MSNIIIMRIQRGSTSFYILTYAMFRSRQKNGTFTRNDYNSFRVSKIRPSYVTRSFNTLLKHGLLERLPDETYRITENGKICLRDHETLYSEDLTKKAKHSRRKSVLKQQALEELQDKNSFDI